MDVRLPDGTVIRGVPDGMSKADLSAKLAKNGYDVSKLNSGANDIPATTALPEADPVQITEKDPNTGKTTTRMQYPSGTQPRKTAAQKQADVDRGRELAAPERTYKDDNLLGRVIGPFDGAASVLSSMAGGAVAPIGGFIKSAISGGDPEANAGQIAQAMQYQPRTGTGAQLSALVGKAAAPLVAFPTATLAQGAQAIGSGAAGLRGMAGPSAAAMAAQDAQMVAGAPKLTASTLADLVRAPKTSTMPGVGAAMTDAATLRAQRAAGQPIPPQLTRGQLTRDFKDIQFERETAKNPDVGGPLRQRYSEQNQNSLDNIEAYFDQTGASTPNLYASGKIVTNAVVNKAKAAKSEIRDAYTKARDAGAMSEEVGLQGLRDYVENNRPSMRNAPVIATLEDELNRLAGDKNQLSINSIEELRKTIGKNGKPNAANSNAGFAPDIIKLIDDATAGKGGPEYQQARRMYENYSNEFRNVGVINKLMSTKPGTKDRAVAYENVYDKTMGGPGVSLDDVRSVRRTLQTAGDEGQQAWRELQGQGIQELRRETFGNISRDEMGNPIASPAKMNAWVEKMDESGKLDFIYGKKGAQQIRDTRDLLMDTHTSPPGSVNSSNTASALAALFDLGASATTGIPLPVATAAKMGVKYYKNKKLGNKVESALNPPEMKMLRDMSGGQ